MSAMEKFLQSPSRRAVVVGGGALFASAFMPRISFAASRDPRLVVVILRGALDGLAAVPSVGDPAYAQLRQDLALSTSGSSPALPLNNLFALHPKLRELSSLYAAGELTVVHAAATPYRERSHFAGQDVLESGYDRPGRVDSGWLNRLFAAVPSGRPVAGPRVLGVGTSAPLIVRGSAPIIGWAPTILRQSHDDLTARVLDLYRHVDPRLGDALAAGVEATDVVDRAEGADRAERADGASQMQGGPAGTKTMVETATGAARLLASDNGPRLAALGFNGWDTHAREGGAEGRLAILLGGLDQAIAAMKTTLGPAWKETVIMIVTEFGRTAHVNGTFGTDHGTATVAFLIGGAVRGKRVIADWPGLGAGQLYEGRDLKATIDLRSIFKGVAADHLGVPEALLSSRVFPGSERIMPQKDLLGG
jgi:uncharacterized protein (DUF1501 family)